MGTFFTGQRHIILMIAGLMGLVADTAAKLAQGQPVDWMTIISGTAALLGLRAAAVHKE